MPYYSRRRRREFPLLNKFAEPRLLQPDVRHPEPLVFCFYMGPPTRDTAMRFQGMVVFMSK